MSELEEVKKELNRVKEQLARERKRSQYYEKIIDRACRMVSSDGGIAKLILDKYTEYRNGNNKEKPFALGITIVNDLNRMVVDGKKGVIIAEDDAELDTEDRSGAGEGPGNLEE